MKLLTEITEPLAPNGKNLFTMLFFGIKFPLGRDKVVCNVLILFIAFILRLLCMLTAEDELVQRVIDTTVRQWCTRLRAC